MKPKRCVNWNKDIKQCVGAYGYEYIVGCKGCDKDCVMYEDGYEKSND